MRVTRRMERQVLKRAAAEFGNDWLKPIAPALASVPDMGGVEYHSFEQWIIARCISRSEKLATEGLERNGFESFYPKGRFIRMKPLRQLPSKTRHKRAEKEFVETERAAYPGYILVRQLFGDFDINRLFDIPGMGGICCFGDRIAMLADHEVELLRVQEAKGLFDQYATPAVASAYHYKLAKTFKPGAEEVEKQYIGESKLVGRACESGSLVTFRKTLDRITRVITAPVTSAAAQ